MTPPRTGLSYDDVLLVPQRSPVDSRRDVDLGTLHRFATVEEQAGQERSDKLEDVTVEEGVEGLSPYRGPLAEAVAEFAAGVRSGLSYCGGHDIPAARENAEFVRVTGGAKEREGAHSIVEL